MACRRWRRMRATLRGAGLRLWLAVARATRAASAAVGAAGGGWALLAAVRAVAEAAGGATARKAAEANAGVAGPLGAGLRDHGPAPRHIAVIMDGNRRYGRRQFGDTLSGHRAGGEKLRDFLEWCVEAGVKFLTVFAFSTENWKRDPAEVEAMMQLFLREVPRLGEHAKRLNASVRFLVSDAGPLPAELRAATAQLEETSSGGTGLRLSVCLSYGGRGDVVLACQKVAREVASGVVEPKEVDENMIARRLVTGDLPDPDILIRTSGERRLSNFLMFQLAYTELFFLEKHWPEVTREDLLDIISKYNTRQRRFGN